MGVRGEDDGLGGFLAIFQYFSVPCSHTRARGALCPCMCRGNIPIDTTQPSEWAGVLEDSDVFLLIYSTGGGACGAAGGKLYDFCDFFEKT